MVNFVGLILVSVAGTIGIIVLNIFIFKRTKSYILMPKSVPIELLLRFAIGYQDLSMYLICKKQINDYQNDLRKQRLKNFSYLKRN